jgi:hypothetical protein
MNNIHEEEGESRDCWNSIAESKVVPFKVTNAEIDFGSLEGEEDVDCHTEGPQTIRRHEPIVGEIECTVVDIGRELFTIE